MILKGDALENWPFHSKSTPLVEDIFEYFTPQEKRSNVPTQITPKKPEIVAMTAQKFKKLITYQRVPTHIHPSEIWFEIPLRSFHPPGWGGWTSNKMAQYTVALPWLGFAHLHGLRKCYNGPGPGVLFCTTPEEGERMPMFLAIYPFCSCNYSLYLKSIVEYSTCEIEIWG